MLNLTENKTSLALLGEFHTKLQKLTIVPRNVQFPEAPGKIKVAIGMRRTGKTYLVFEKISQLIKNHIDLTSILYVNFEDDRLLPLTSHKVANLVDAFYALYPENHDRKCYLFLDEIQNVENWPLLIRRLHDTKNLEIFLAGSSAKLLGKEIATNLRGRSLAIEVWPYSFEEYMKALNVSNEGSLFSQKKRDQFAKCFHRYLSDGGFPEVTFFDPNIQQQVLQEYIDIVIYRDIIERHQIKNTTVIKSILLTILHNIARPLSANKIYNDLKGRGFSLSREHVYEYMSYIEDAYVAFAVPLFDKSIRKIQTNPKKMYAIDPGMVRSVTMDYESDLGRLFENVVYLDLRRKGYEVDYYLTQQRYEVDFLAQTPKGEKKLFQVAWDVSNPKTLERELRALEIAKQELGVEGKLITLESYLQHGLELR
jgi:predicted AAA+ superfamily ATPase